MTLVTSKVLKVLGLCVTSEQMWQDVYLSTWEILTNWSGNVKYFLFGHFPIISHPSSASCFFLCLSPGCSWMHFGCICQLKGRAGGVCELILGSSTKEAGSGWARDGFRQQWLAGSHCLELPWWRAAVVSPACSVCSLPIWHNPTKQTKQADSTHKSDPKS